MSGRGSSLIVLVMSECWVHRSKGSGAREWVVCSLILDFATDAHNIVECSYRFIFNPRNISSL